MSVSWTAYRRARRRSRQAWALLALAVVSALAALAWFFTDGQFALAEPTGAGPAEAPVFDPVWMKPVAPVRPVPDASALSVLEGLPVKGRAPAANYQREAFGQAWLDADRNGCDTRNDILRRDLAELEFMERSGCRVSAGRFQDPYTAKTIDFRRGADTSREVQIDHVVALSDAWQKGAQQLTAGQRQNFANDPVNLVAADGAANQQKGAGDAATWLPRNKAFRCHYVARQVSVKAAYGLWVTPAEKEAMQRVLATCPGQGTIRAR
ncbi:HNH endonuclease family protein [Pseudarthrobacter sp. NPDC092439]|uniref:HNH endonuclease family protein n=1 Tax=unclassified Pseudarthrobacter TaxID=2647000 RepID=UPI00380F52A8